MHWLELNANDVVYRKGKFVGKSPGRTELLLALKQTLDPIEQVGVGVCFNRSSSPVAELVAQNVEKFIEGKVSYVSLDDSLFSFHDKPLPFIRNCAKGSRQASNEYIGQIFDWG
jgi:hypothetical protein